MRTSTTLSALVLSASILLAPTAAFAKTNLEPSKQAARDRAAWVMDRDREVPSNLWSTEVYVKSFASFEGCKTIKGSTKKRDAYVKELRKQTGNNITAGLKKKDVAKAVKLACTAWGVKIK